MTGLIHVAYIISALLFILSLAGLSKQETAKLGCTSGIIGMTIALIATLVNVNTGIGWGIIVVAVIIGAGIGLYLAKKVEMTQMPELVAMLHSFVGLAAVLVGFNSFLSLCDVSLASSLDITVNGNVSDALAAKISELKEMVTAEDAAKAAVTLSGKELLIHLVEVFLGVFIGAVTFTGSIVAYGKLNGSFKLAIF